MADTVSKEKRSEIMSHVTGKETKPEIIVRKYLFARGLRYRKNVKRLPGTPDIVFPKYKTAVFVNGCFWHGHENCKAATLPSSNVDYWRNKISSNVERDKKQQMQLEQMGYKVFVIWQCQLNSKEQEDTLQNLVEELTVKDCISHQ